MVTIDSLSLLEEAILVLSESEVSRVSDINFIVKNIDSLKEQARQQALSKALLKAKKMAEQAGAKLKRILYISPDTPMDIDNNSIKSIRRLPGVNAAVNSDDEFRTFYEPTITIEEAIYLVYELE